MQTVIIHGGHYTTSVEAANVIRELRCVVIKIQCLPAPCCYHPEWIEQCIEAFILAWVRDKTSTDLCRLQRYECAYNSALSMPRVLMDLVLPDRHELEADVEKLHYL